MSRSTPLNDFFNPMETPAPKNTKKPNCRFKPSSSDRAPAGRQNRFAGMISGRGGGEFLRGEVKGPMRRGRERKALRLTGRLVFAGLFLAFGAAAEAQGVDCARLKAALDAPVQTDPAAAAEARRVQAKFKQTAAYAHSIGCDNHQFLFFGKPPPPQCGRIKTHMADMRARYEALRARASGESPQRRALAQRYNASCVAHPHREKSFFDVLFGGFGEAPMNQEAQPAVAPPAPAGSSAGSEVLCVRTCDGGYFPMSFSTGAASMQDLQALCSAQCPNAQVEIFTRVPNADITTAVSADGTPYRDLPNALLYTKSYDPTCACKPPNESWVDALANAEQVLDQMGGAKASDTTVTVEQSKAMSQPMPPKPGKGGAAKPETVAPQTENGVRAAPSRAAPKPGAKAPDGRSHVRVVAPNL
jgi:Protein of unknown function (DUF2865)